MPPKIIIVSSYFSEIHKIQQKNIWSMPFSAHISCGLPTRLIETLSIFPIPTSLIHRASKEQARLLSHSSRSAGARGCVRATSSHAWRFWWSSIAWSLDSHGPSRTLTKPLWWTPCHYLWRGFRSSLCLASHDSDFLLHCSQVSYTCGVYVCISMLFGIWHLRALDVFVCVKGKWSCDYCIRSNHLDISYHMILYRLQIIWNSSCRMSYVLYTLWNLRFHLHEIKAQKFILYFFFYLWTLYHRT